MSGIPTRRLYNPLAIGIFAVSGVALLVILLLWLGATSFFEDHTLYVTYFNTSVQGLESGQPVKYQGVPVGNIQSLNVASDGKLIEVMMQVNKGIRLNDSMRVRIEMASIAGSKYLLLFYPDHPQATWGYPDISIIKPQYPVIKSAPSEIEEIRVSLNETLNNLLAIDTRGISIQSVRTLRAIAELLERPEIEQILGNVQRSSVSLSHLLGAADTTKMVQRFTTITSDAQIMTKNFVATSEHALQTSIHLEQSVQRLDSVLRTADITARLEKTFSRYDSLTLAIEQTTTSLGKKSELTLEDVRSLTRELRSTNRELRRSVRSLSENPGRALFAEPSPKER